MYIVEFVLAYGVCPRLVMSPVGQTDHEEGYAPMLIFAVNSPSTKGGCNPTECWGFRLYSFQIYEGAELKRDFVPCVSATEGAGLWDLVEGKFYPNNGDTAFNTP